MTAAAPRLLYLAHAFPPAPAVGCVRSWNTARWLAALGWSVTVVTPEPSVWLNAEEPEKARARVRAAGLSQLLTGHCWPMLEPDYLNWIPGYSGWLLGGVCRVVARRLGVEASAGWAASVERACAGLKQGDFDLILATGSPFISFRLARRLGRRLSCPFVMDYRDPWTGNPHRAHGARRPASSPEEAELIRDCAAATVVSPSWARLIGETFRASGKVSVISNGFDPDMFVDVRPRRFGHFSVVYAGTLYPPKRTLDPVLRAFQSFVRRAPSAGARFHYYGDYSGPVREAAARLGVSALVAAHGRVSRAAALEAQKGADLIVVVASVEDEGTLADRGVVTGKVFDCMALGRPALVVAPRGSDLYPIAETAGGMRCFTGSDIEGMTRYIGEAACGKTPPGADPRAYRWDTIAAELDLVLRGAIAQGSA